MPRYLRDRFGRFASAAARLGDIIMKKITLHSPAARNDGTYADAGETLTIGDKPDEIAADRAKDLTDGSRAVSETAGKVEERAAAKEKDEA